jgi:Tfp pilus assembly protein PilO
MRLRKFNELTASEHRVIVAALCIIGVLAVHNRLVSPHLASLHAAQQYERAVATAIDESKGAGQQLQTKHQELDRLVTEQKTLSEGVFRPAEVEPFFNELEHLCAETQCLVVSFSHGAGSYLVRRGVSDANAPVVQKTAKLTLQGGYGNIVQLIEKLQTYPRKVWIDKLKISSASSTLCALDISIYVHRNKENELHD